MPTRKSINNNVSIILNDLLYAQSILHQPDYKNNDDLDKMVII